MAGIPFQACLCRYCCTQALNLQATVGMVEVAAVIILSPEGQPRLWIGKEAIAWKIEKYACFVKVPFCVAPRSVTRRAAHS
jgi:hypothetical protein